MKRKSHVNTDTIKSALIEAKNLLDFYIGNIEDITDEDITDKQQIISIKHFILALNVGCECDSYVGFDCGCGKRAFLINEALKELGIK